MEKLTVGLLNDSFPPTIDGVASSVLNYAKAIQKSLGTAIVATPWYPKVQDEYPFEVVRYPSAYISKRLGYRAGYPFDPVVISYLKKQKIDVIHTHCPFISGTMARVLRIQTGAPIVFTYHTKFDIDIEKRVALNPVRNVSVRFLLSNINACDEVWVVSEGAGENLRSLGYTGNYIVMRNGTDFQKGRATEEQIAELNQKHGFSEEETVFLFVGRMMWYKGVKTSIDGLKLAKEKGMNFKMVFIGEGVDRPDIMEYIKDCGLEENCIFTGALRDRELLRVYFSRANLFLFPSTYDTNGIVVTEAAACSCPSVLIRESCAAEAVVDEDTGILIEETPAAMAEAIVKACGDHERLRRIGEAAAEKVYLSWDDAVAIAYERYRVVLENSKKKVDASHDKLLFNQGFFDDVQHIKDDYEIQKSRLLRLYYQKGQHLKRKIRNVMKRKR